MQRFPDISAEEEGEMGGDIKRRRLLLRKKNFWKRDADWGEVFLGEEFSEASG